MWRRVILYWAVSQTINVKSLVTLYSPVVTICTAILTFNNSTFCPHTVYMSFVWISEQTAIIPTICKTYATRNLSFPLTFHWLAHHTTHSHDARYLSCELITTDAHKSHQLFNSNISLQIARCLSTVAMWRYIICCQVTTRPVATARLHNRRSKRALCTMPGTRCGPNSSQLQKHPFLVSDPKFLYVFARVSHWAPIRSEMTLHIITP